MQRLLLALFLLLSLSLPAIEREISLGREEQPSWKDLIFLDGLTKKLGKWNTQDLVLEEGEYGVGGATELLIHFNTIPFAEQTGRYTVVQSSPLLSEKVMVLGSGSAAFQTDLNDLRLIPGSSAEPWRSFSIEFWLYPVTLSNGETILSWFGTLETEGRIESQSISCRVANRILVWEFSNFFSASGGSMHTVSGISPLLPRTWHHHLVRFDSETGLLEYLVDNRPEGIAYVTDSGRDGGTVRLPDPDQKGFFLLGRKFTGLMDELRISRRFLENPSMSRYLNKKGTAVTRIFDLDYVGSRVLEIRTTHTKPSNSEVYYYYRSANELESPTQLAARWIPFVPNQPFDTPIQGRYLQLMVELLPDGTGAHSPRVSDIKVLYEPDLPPAPPAHLTALAGDASVQLKWQRVTQRDVGGYRVYYGTSPGHYGGAGSAEGPSPIDVRNQTSITLTNLQNGRLYYFAVVSYDSSDPRNHSIFSKEVSARPSSVLP
jgi:hypothetical protein